MANVKCSLRGVRRLSQVIFFAPKLFISIHIVAGSVICPFHSAVILQVLTFCLFKLLFLKTVL